MSWTPRPAPVPDDARASARAVRRRAGVLWWRLRFVVAAVCCGLAATATVSALRPEPPPTVPVVVTAREVSAGDELAAADVRVVEVPAGLAPEALRSPDEAVGRSASVRIAPGTALQESLVAAGDLVSAAPPGTVVAPVRLDPGVSGLLAAGDRVDLLVASPATGLTGVAGEPAAADGADPYLARGAVVVPGRPDESASGGLLGSPATTGEQTTLVAVLPEEAERLAAVAGWGQVTAVLVP
ncbi:SAF domain-containing protein [Cellulosimicrobium sp. PMB13]|uniref:SAF domain-containing protein n=1 Tax=Cellulosimicrobium sp. PMB13 TaxID=3120158 RepID=UPI003F4B5673